MIYFLRQLSLKKNNISLKNITYQISQNHTDNHAEIPIM